MNGLRALDASPPILMAISFLGMSGVELYFNPGDFTGPPQPYKRETLHLPHAILTEYRDDENYESFAAEQMDFLWNAFGLERCFLTKGY